MPRALLLAALLLAACAGPPPEGLAPPVASEAGPVVLPDDTAANQTAPDQATDQARAAISLPGGARLVALEVTLPAPPPDLLDDQQAGVITLTAKTLPGEARARTARPRPIRLVFVNGALGLHALRPGAYAIETIAGYDCGPLGLAVPPGDAPIALGSLTLDGTDSHGAFLSGGTLTPDDLARVADLAGTDPAAIDADPLERGSAIPCAYRPRAVSRPDFDPTVKRLTALEVAGGLMFGGIVAAALVAGSSVAFVSGPLGGFLLLGL